MKRYDSSLQADSNVAKAENSVDKLHYSVSQAMSHPTDQTIEQAHKSLTHAQRAIQQAEITSGSTGVQLAEELLSEEQKRLTSLDAKKKG